MKYPDDFMNQIICDDCLEVMKTMPDDCIDTIITDPPYKIGFMGKDWDKLDDKYREGEWIPCETGYSNCGCNAGFEPGIVLDLFMGAGTTALVALKQRKRFIGIEIKQEYIKMAEKRISKGQQELI